jgi:exopolysaccharide biosynthesis polyprenyl glycosylphosphotransferase
VIHQFSPRRVIWFFLLDWLGTVALLHVADRIVHALASLPQSGARFFGEFTLPIGGPGAVNAANRIGVVADETYILVSMIWPFFLALVFLVYDGRQNETILDELRHIFLAVIVSTMTLAGVLYLTYRETPRTVFLTFAILDLALLLGSRVLFWVYRRARNGRVQAHRRSVLIVGAGGIGRKVAHELSQYAWADLRLVGYVDDDTAKQGREVDGLPVFGTLDGITDIVKAHAILDAVITLPSRAHERLAHVCQTLQEQGVRVYVVPDFFSLSFPNAKLDGFGGIPVLDLGHLGLSDGRRWAKRVFDVSLSAVGLVVTAPFMLAIALWIRLDSRGPILYRQPRVGEGGRAFLMFKFRSMQNGADVTPHQAHVTRLIKENLAVADLNDPNRKGLKLTGDPRITRVGRFIRSTSLDELPQLLNVLRGEMSLVGPRPPLPYEVDVYKPWHMRRLNAVPGITGLWQVKGRNRVSFDEMVRIDLEYIQHQSIWLDIAILLRTPLAVLSGRGAG